MYPGVPNYLKLNQNIFINYFFFFFYFLPIIEYSDFFIFLK